MSQVTLLFLIFAQTFNGFYCFCLLTSLGIGFGEKNVIQAKC